MWRLDSIGVNGWVEARHNDCRSIEEGNRTLRNDRKPRPGILLIVPILSSRRANTAAQGVAVRERSNAEALLRYRARPIAPWPMMPPERKTGKLRRSRRAREHRNLMIAVAAVAIVVGLAFVFAVIEISTTLN